jgi:arsenate reductase
MAQGFLQSFDKHINVCSAGTEPAKQVNPKAVKVMQEVGIDISHHTPKMVDQYLNDEWDFVITVCDNANETCPAFLGKVKNREHIGFEDPTHATGTDEYIWSEFRRVRNEIKQKLFQYYNDKIRIF